MSIFEDVKNSTNLLSVAEHYGLDVRRGFTNCIFHDDSNPSMKLYKDHYHCFGCGAHGDVISFTAQLSGISPFEAAKKLSADFGVTKGFCESPNNKHDISDSEAFKLLLRYVNMLEQNRDAYRPRSSCENLHPLYIQSLQQLPTYKYYLDIMTTGSKEERAEFVIQEGRMFHELREKMRQPRMAVC